LKKSEKITLAPIGISGIKVVKLGTFLWAQVLVILILSNSWLEETGRTHWIWIAVSGVVLGLLGYRYSTRRAKRLGLSYSTKLFASKTKEPDQSQLVQDFE
jgi:hypothetical protein